MKKEKQKPIVGQKVFVLISGKIHDGEILEVTDTPLAHDVGIYYTFKLLIKQAFVPATEWTYGNIRDKIVCSSSFHLEPGPDDNITWSWNNHFAQAFVFPSMESYDQYIIDYRRYKREYHLNQAKLYE